MSTLFRKGKISSKKDVREFIDTYAKDDNWHEIDREKGNLGYGWIHYALIKNFKPVRVLVIGSRYGFVPAICALACRDNKKGSVDFVDAGYDQANPKHNSKLGAKKNLHWGGVGFWVKNDAKKHFAKFDLDEYIKIHIMTSGQFNAGNPRGKWAYVYLDADHSYNGVRADFRRFWPRIKKRGLLLLHDIYTKQLGGLEYGVNRFWEEKKESRKYNMLEVPGKFGLGIIQK